MQIVELEKDNHEEGNGQPNGVAGRDLTPKMMTILGYTFDPIRVIKNVVQLTGPVADHSAFVFLFLFPILLAGYLKNVANSGWLNV